MDSADKLSHFYHYCESLTTYCRRRTIGVNVGGVSLGSQYPIRAQSMTTTNTLDTEGTVKEAIRMIEAGCEYVRITAPARKDAENLGNIRRVLRQRGYNTPLIADIHFAPAAAEVAARLVEKVRINPGNYADKKSRQTAYSDADYRAALAQIRERFLPLLKICKTYGTAMRIGTNHGSLSDRIMSRYGDTPLGMVESALEFLRICEDEGYDQVVLSMKASNTRIMVQAYRLLVRKMAEEKMKPYPLHLGVTEAGEAEDGRIKSAVGIGTLLEDGLGDTVRVSLTEPPEAEIPVAKQLIGRYARRAETQKYITPIAVSPKNPYQYQKRETQETENIGGENPPRVIADLSPLAEINIAALKHIGHHYLPEPDKWIMTDQGADYLYTGKKTPAFMLPNGLKQIIDFELWENTGDQKNSFPLFSVPQYLNTTSRHPHLNFLRLEIGEMTNLLCNLVHKTPHTVFWIHSENAHAMAEMRRFFFDLLNTEIKNPVLVERSYPNDLPEKFILRAATDLGGLLLEGFGDAICLKTKLPETQKICNTTAFGILQAARCRMSKTEYISCPSCGRTLFDLQDTTARIRKQTDHLKGIKIGIMGCIVNGPGEMADADYGYVGSGKGKITLYKGKEVIERNVSSENAVEALIEIIRKDGKWISPPKNNGRQK